MGERVRVRPVLPEDGPAMGHVHVRAWQVGYRHLLPAAFLDGLDGATRGALWTNRIESGETSGRDVERPSITVVGELDGVVGGICTYGVYRPVAGVDPVPMGPSDPADRSPFCELWGLNVDPEAWGTGLAQALMAHALDGLAAARPEPVAALWVLAGNARGRRFYEKQGWGPDGVEQTSTLGGVDLPQVRYVIDLAPFRAA